LEATGSQSQAGGRHVARSPADLEAPPIDDATRARLEKLIARHGAATVTLCIRAILESEGNQSALIEPVIGAVLSAMLWRRARPEKGLAFIEAFDSVPLLDIIATMRSWISSRKSRSRSIWR
jgi:hypothetical protein